MERSNTRATGRALSLLPGVVLLFTKGAKKNPRVNQKERKKQYALLCEQKKITSLFLQPWWLEATGPWDVSFAYRNNQLIGAMPFATGKKWGIKFIGMPSMTHHMSLWLDKPPDISSHKWLTREKQII